MAPEKVHSTPAQPSRLPQPVLQLASSALLAQTQAPAERSTTTAAPQVHHECTHIPTHHASEMGPLFRSVIQPRLAQAGHHAPISDRRLPHELLRPNLTRLPHRLQAGVEHLSGLAMDDVTVHYNSAKPGALGAFAYTQGTEIYVGPGQERYLPHEAWHVVQQKQGRVQPSIQFRGASINQDGALEQEADRMGARAMSGLLALSGQGNTAYPAEDTTSPIASRGSNGLLNRQRLRSAHLQSGVIQCYIYIDASKRLSVDKTQAKLQLLRELRSQRVPKQTIQSLETRKIPALIARYVGDKTNHRTIGELATELLAPPQPAQTQSLALPTAIEQTAVEQATIEPNEPDQEVSSPVVEAQPLDTSVNQASTHSNPSLKAEAEEEEVLETTPSRPDLKEEVGDDDYLEPPPVSTHLEEEMDEALLEAMARSLQPSLTGASSMESMEPSEMGGSGLTQEVEEDETSVASSGVTHLLNSQGVAVAPNPANSASPANSAIAQQATGGATQATWADYREESPKVKDEAQKFGVEVELNHTRIPYYGDGPADKRFYNFAVTQGHKGFMKHKDKPIELHLDHLAKGIGKLEIVGHPPQLLADFVDVLDYLKTELLGKPLSQDWFAKFDWKEVDTLTAYIQNYIKKNFSGTTTVTGMPVQVTTTHTAKELRKILPVTKEPFLTSLRKNPKTRVNELVKMSDLLKLEETDDLDDFIIKRYLGNITPLKDRKYEGKGSTALVKHAAEQFTRGPRSRAVIPLATPVDRIRKMTPFLNELHTNANKPAPVFKRGGEIAYVVEYRTGSHIAPIVNNFLLGKLSKEKLIEALSRYVGQ